MHRRTFAASLPALLTSAALPLPAAAQQKIDGRGGRFEDEWIARLEGDWLLTRQIRGSTVQNTLAAQWVLEHQFLQLHMKDLAQPPKYEALVLIGFVYATNEYVAHWTDTFGAKFAGVGRGRRSGHAVEFRFDYADGPFFNTFTWLPEAAGWQMKLESQDEAGKRRLFALDTLARKAA